MSLAQLHHPNPTPPRVGPSFARSSPVFSASRAGTSDAARPNASGCAADRPPPTLAPSPCAYEYACLGFDFMCCSGQGLLHVRFKITTGVNTVVVNENIVTCFWPEWSYRPGLAAHQRAPRSKAGSAAARVRKRSRRKMTVREQQQSIGAEKICERSFTISKKGTGSSAVVGAWRVKATEGGGDHSHL